MGPKLKAGVIIAAALFGLVAAPPVALSDQPVPERAAFDVAEGYFAALQAGDLQALRGMLAGRARQETEARLSKPGYGPFLIERYRTARLDVPQVRVRRGVTFLDLKIWLNDREFLMERLKLKPSPGAPDDPPRIVARKSLLR